MPAPNGVKLRHCRWRQFGVQAMKGLGLLVVGQRQPAAGFIETVVSTEAIGLTCFSGQAPPVGLLQPLQSAPWGTHGGLASAHRTLGHARSTPQLMGLSPAAHGRCGAQGTRAGHTCRSLLSQARSLGPCGLADPMARAHS